MLHNSGMPFGGHILGRLASAIGSLALSTLPGLADYVPCGCSHLESITNRVAVADTMRGRMTNKVAELDTYIREIKRRNQLPEDNPDYSDVDAELTAKQLYYDWINLNGPGGAYYDLPPIAGPARIDFDSRRCDIAENDKNLIREIEACRDIADAELAHEAYHTSICLAEGRGERYESRSAPATAREEASAYEIELGLLHAALAEILAREASLVMTARTVDGFQTFRGGTMGQGAGSSDLNGTARVRFSAEFSGKDTATQGACTFQTVSSGSGIIELGLVLGRGAFQASHDMLAGTVTVTCPDMSYGYELGLPAGMHGTRQPLPLANGATVREEGPNTITEVLLACPTR